MSNLVVDDISTILSNVLNITSLIDSNFGAFTISTDLYKGEIFVFGPGGFQSNIRYLPERERDLYGNVGAMPAGVATAYSTSLMSAVNLVYYRVTELIQSNIESNVHQINSNVHQINGNIHDINLTHAILSKDVQDLRDRGVDETLGIVGRGIDFNGNIHSFTRAMAVNALRTSHMLDNVIDEMNNPTELPWQNYSHDATGSSIRGSLGTYERYGN